ncbi:MAG: anhydro-N-acetylmuramic acid kinase [Gammaproteobacteria bacterium]|nr:anhydro-N-acetylmuramic acid kinase [Gammaproteobacteria bacterium]MDH3767378.1 anhydro-N-acetylmuramic acid kinase [Gammaproteobacteria bacterium]
MVKTVQRYIGLMSGTSMDGVDAGLLVFGKDVIMDRGITHPFPPDLHKHLVHVVDHPTQVSLDELGELDTALGECFSDAVVELLSLSQLEAADITAIGSHGQTIRHGPSALHPFSMQIGDANVIVARTGITTVADFRRRDVALGGQGAPLTPAFHDAVFSHSDENRVVVNIGGMSNMTALSVNAAVAGHDTGPGNVLMDAWAKQHHDQPFDNNGAWARTGNVNNELLQLLLSEEFFQLAPPKSTGRELFNLPWLTAHLLSMDAAPEPADVQATLCELTALSIAEAIKAYAPEAQRCLVCGGGARNEYLMDRLNALISHCVAESTERYGIAPEWVEAAAFAWLARQTLLGRDGNMPAVTGAAHSAVLGVILSAGSA